MKPGELTLFKLIGWVTLMCFRSLRCECIEYVIGQRKDKGFFSNSSKSCIRHGRGGGR